MSSRPGEARTILFLHIISEARTILLLHIISAVFFQQNRGTIGLACAQAAALRGAPTTACRHVAAPRHPQTLHMAYNDHDQNVSRIHGFD